MARFVIAALCLLVAAEVQCLRTNSNGTSGEDCDGKLCPTEDSYCDRTYSPARCRCQGVGHGGLLCGTEANQITSIINDPKVETYDKENLDILIPCQYLLTHVKTSFTTRSGREVSCNIKVWVANRRIKGKQFVSNVMVRIKTDGLRNDKDYTYKVDGAAGNGRYRFWQEMKCGNGEFGDNLDSSIARSPVIFSIDNTTNRALIRHRKCGIAVAFRPADKHLGKDQSQLPGVVVKLSANVGVEYKSNDVVAGIRRDAFRNGNDFGPEDRPAIDTMVYRAIMSDAPQLFKWKSGECNGIGNVFRHCEGNPEEITNALRYCRFALFRPKFVSCWSDENEDRKADSVLDLYKRCIKSRCKKSSNKCQRVKDDIDDHPNCKAELENHEEEILNDTCEFD